MSKKIKTKALALIKNLQGKILVQKLYDSSKEQSFYRPLGGNVNFQEAAKDCIVREIQEEIGVTIEVIELLEVIENMFTYGGEDHHELDFLFACQIEKVSDYKEFYPVTETSGASSQASWKTLEEIKEENIPLYPLEIEKHC